MTTEEMTKKSIIDVGLFDEIDIQQYSSVALLLAAKLCRHLQNHHWVTVSIRSKSFLQEVSNHLAVAEDPEGNALLQDFLLEVLVSGQVLPGTDYEIDNVRENILRMLNNDNLVDTRH